MRTIVAGAVLAGMLGACKPDPPAEREVTAPAPPVPPAPTCGNGRVEPGEACDIVGAYVGECPDGWAVCRVCTADCTVALAEFGVIGARLPDRPGLTSITGPEGAPATYAYDDKGHLVHKRVGTVERTYRWDERGRLVFEGSEGEEIHYEHLGEGPVRNLRITTVIEGGPPRREDRVDEYDAEGRLVASTLGDRTTRWTYDAHGQVTSYATPGARFTTAYAYDAHGRVTLRRADTATTHFTHDAGGRVITEEVDVGLGGPGNARTTHTYGPTGLLERTTRTGDPIAGPRDSTFRYDDHGNLIESVVDGVTTRFGYDLALLARWRAEAPWRQVRAPAPPAPARD